VSCIPSLSIKDGHFLSGNVRFSFHGINWFGFNNKQTMVDGLWAGGSSAATDFLQMIQTIKLLGFNAVRLPFTFSDLNLRTIDQSTPCNQWSKEDTIRRACDPYRYDALKYPPQLFSYPLSSVCNKYVSNGQTIDRFLWVIKEFILHDFYVVIDYHPMNTENISFEVSKFVSEWTSLWAKLMNHPNYKTHIKGRIILDLLNEPDSMGISWNPKNGKPGATELYLAAIDALYKMDSSTLFMIEGTGQAGYNLNWGDGFVTDKSIIKSTGIDDPNRFFQNLVSKPYKNNVIISPHIYGPSISLNTHASTGSILFNRLYYSFGTLYVKGYCYKNACKSFPLIIGEFGSKFEDQRDLHHMNDFAKWLKTVIKDYNWFYWAYNENSGDTGGIVKDNWQNIAWTKIRWLVDNMKLKPWYL
jgi:aryl-phospho-beta-D-glucosidase BglC (GH1 family)